MSLFRPSYTDKKTGKQKQSAFWWYEFSFAGKRIRESAKTTRKTIAAEAEKQRRLQLERAMAGIPTERPESRIPSVSEALESYTKSYLVNHRPKSAEWVKERSVPLKRLLGSLLFPDITRPEQILDYMEQRQQEGASHRTVNMELETLSRAVGQKWSTLWPTVAKLEENKDVGRALEPEEEKALLEAAARNHSPLLYPYLMTLAWTGMRDSEGRLLKWEQIDFEAGEARVGKAKTEKGARRVIPMSGPLRAALEQHLAQCAVGSGPSSRTGLYSRSPTGADRRTRNDPSLR